MAVSNAVRHGMARSIDSRRIFTLSSAGILPFFEAVSYTHLDVYKRQDIMEQMKTQGESYTNYTGITNDMEGTVKFVMKVQPVEKAETTQQTNESGDSQEEQPNFWQRLWNLFTGLFH